MKGFIGRGKVNLRHHCLSTMLPLQDSSFVAEGIKGVHPMVGTNTTRTNSTKWQGHHWNMKGRH